MTLDLGTWQSKIQLYKHFEFVFSHQNIRRRKVLRSSVHKIARSPAGAKVADFYAEVKTALLWPPPDRLRKLRCSVWGRASTQNFFSRIATGRRKQGMHFKGLNCQVVSFLAQTRHGGVPRKASLPWIDAAETDMEGKRKVLLSIRYKYIYIYLYRDLIVQSCMPYGHSMWSECGPSAPTRSWP